MIIKVMVDEVAGFQLFDTLLERRSAEPKKFP